MEFGVQIVSFAVLLTIIVNYFSNQRMPLTSTRLYTAFLILAMSNIVFEFFSLFTLYFLEIDNPLVLFSHQLFIASINFMIFFLFLYVDVQARALQRYNIQQLLVRMLPLLLSLFVVFLGKIEYHIDGMVRYSSGPMAMTVYFSVAFYMIMIVAILVKKKHCFTDKERNLLLIGVLLWSSVAVFQFFKPELCISSMGIVLMVQLIYMVFENPQEYTDFEVNGTMNRHAFEMMLSEILHRGNTFYILTVVFSNMSLMNNSFGYKTKPWILNKAAVNLKKITSGKVYHCDDNSVSVILSPSQLEDVDLKALWLASAIEVQKRGVKPKYFINVMESPRYADTAENILETLDFIVSDDYNRTEDIFMVDDNLIYQKNYMTAADRLVQNAIREKNFDVYYQPIYSTSEKAFVSSEALIRIKDASGFISPEIFIPIAEKRGLISELGNIVFEKVCCFSAKNKLWNYGVKYVEVNISGLQSVDPKLSENLIYRMNSYGVPPEFINFEITETAIIDSESVLEQNMIKLRGAGCHFSMDDFGTGYSNLSKTTSINFELIKLDKSLLWSYFQGDGKEKNKALAVLVGCIEMLKKLGAAIVAEGVETSEQASFLTERGVDYLQGYFFSKPIPEEEYISFLKNKNGGEQNHEL